ncbi:MAG: HEAT repeat domain-containing protein [Desulfarculaceae bacterium]|nr:HEAT repeat domain-containing protein [Desulfarculaceae bacterium]MCF8072703.1 HEAT repeat domain-containing protein [Desulfarculaceae bacterium]MCF8102582.1 HEAT repeat domain-containing protein [Desulfarculaceae bacterium]MCF8116491.1 HEAT repeat domain-containing protein [Desulfarculaceae bacterium]
MNKAAAMVGRWLKVQPNEIGLFLWSAALLYLIRTANIFFNNFAETAFLKRFGVEYLPIVYVANSLTTFVIMAAITGLLRKLPSGRMLAYMMMFCGLSVAALRPVLEMGVDLIYPVLFLLKAQYEGLLALVFWNLANDLFNTRQSKRIFPLITAGGVIGAIVGSFVTPGLARTINFDNLMLAYGVVACAGALCVWEMSRRYPVLNMPERDAKKGGKKSGLLEEFKQIVPMLKESTLLKILVLLTLLPNIVLPIMNYQFNYAVNETYATEGGMVTFFGYFRGVLNIISLIILLFVGKLYNRWGLPVALMFHPINYVIAFGAFLFNFSIYSAMYARISTRVLLVTINNPARNILVGLFPDKFRALLRPFLRGTVVRIGILLGSGVIFLSEHLFHPRWLSLVGMAVGLIWVVSTIWLKRSYSDILLGLIGSNVIDLKSLEEQDVGVIFKDKRAQEQLVDACLNSQGRACLWYAEMMRAQQVPDLDQHLLQLIRTKDEQTAMDLLPLIPSSAGPAAVAAYSELADPARPKLNAALAVAATRLPWEVSGGFLQRLYDQQSDPQVRAQAVVGLYRHDPVKYETVISDWLASQDREQRRAGVVAAGGSGNQEFRPRLRDMLASEEDNKLRGEILVALNRLDDPHLHELVQARLSDDPAAVPLEVLNDFHLNSEADIKAFIHLLGSEDPERHEMALSRLEALEDLDSAVLIESMTLPNRRIRDGLYRLMAELKISDREIIAFARSNLEFAYLNLAEVKALGKLPEGPERDLLTQHLTERIKSRINTILRVLSTQEESDQMRLIIRGLSSVNAKMRSNAVEALESMVGHDISQAMIPLLEDGPVNETLALGRKLFKMPLRFAQTQELFADLLAKKNWVTLYLSLLVLGSQDTDPEPFMTTLERLAGHKNPYVSQEAGRLMARARKPEGRS